MNDVFDTKTFLKTMTSQFGVYRIYDADGTVIYIGRAKDLKRRLSSYFRSNLASRKTEALVALIAQVDMTVTHTETEALLLEHNCIKLYQSRYNVLSRDDKSYPFIFLSGGTHPHLAMHRGAKHTKGEYLGSLPNGYTVRETLALLQKTFPTRQCENSIYRSRSCPCLQYQIGHHLGPCIARSASEEEHTQQAKYARLFLVGKDDQALTQFIARMEKASQDLEFEEAVHICDQIQAVRRVTEEQFVSNTGSGLDVIGVAFEAGMACIHVLFICQGKVLGNRSHFPKIPGGTGLGEVVEMFIGQFYLQGSQMRTLPGGILFDLSPGDRTLLAELLSELTECRINVQTKPRGDRVRYLKLVRTNAVTALAIKLAQQSTTHQHLQALATVLELSAMKRMECFDTSHAMGEQTMASCVVFDNSDPLRAEYRRYNIIGIIPGGDCTTANQVLRRRYSKAIDENKVPDVVLIDGEKGQSTQMKAVFAELDVPWDKHHPLLLGVAKSSDYKAGLKTLFLEPEGEGFSLPPDSPALHVIQHIRDESYDHTISEHRKKRVKVENISPLETIEGVGLKRRQMLLKHMGGLQGLQQASVEEIAKVPDISYGLTKKILRSLKHQGLYSGIGLTLTYSRQLPVTIRLDIPILLTLFRVILIPFFVLAFYLPLSWVPFARALIFFVTAATDWFDGFLARRWDQSTRFGAFLDLVANKVMVAITAMLIVEHYHTWWITLPAATMIVCEIIILALHEWMVELGKRSSVAVSWIGKVKTTAQMAVLVWVLWRPYPWVEWVGIAFFLVAAVLTLWSVLQYLNAARGDLLDQ